jgi:hypothetical protein
MWKMITFGEGSHGHRAAAKRLEGQANAGRAFDEVERFDAKILRRRYPDFFREHSGFLESNPRGFGYWIWKPFLILRALEELPENWNLAYIDGGCVFNLNEVSRHRLQEYKDHASRNSVWCTELTTSLEQDYRNETWCKEDALRFLEADRVTASSNQVQAGMLMLSNNQTSRDLVADWYKAAISEGYRFIDDSKSISKNSLSFIEHRHDQALFSVLFRQRNLRALPDESFFPNAWTTDGAGFPIWAARWTFSTPFSPNKPRGILVWMEQLLRMGPKGVIREIKRRLDSVTFGRLKFLRFWVLLKTVDDPRAPGSGERFHS